MSNTEGSSVRILYVEDDLHDRELIARTLRRDDLHCEFVYATRETDFKRALNDLKLDLILSDFTFPSFSGTKALALAKAMRPEVAVSGVRFRGHGKKTVDVQEIKERFGSLKVSVDWKRLETVISIRNDIEHHTSSVPPPQVRELLADSFVVVGDFITQELKGDPAQLLGAEPKELIKEDLRRFKQLMEAGEIAAVAGQSSGRAGDAHLAQGVRRWEAGERDHVGRRSVAPDAARAGDGGRPRGRRTRVPDAGVDGRERRADLAGLLALSAPHRERARLQTLLGDLAATLHAVPVCPAGKPHEGVTGTAEGSDLHLEDGDGDVLLEVGIRGLGRVQSCAHLSAVAVVRTDRAEPPVQPSIFWKSASMTQSRSWSAPVSRWSPPETQPEKTDAAALKAWWQQIAEWRSKDCLKYDRNSKIIKPQFVLEKLYEVTKGDAFVTSDVGQHQMWAAQFYKFEEPRRWINSGGLGTMGFGLPAAMGVQLANPGATVACVTGESSIMMCLQELSTCKQYRLPIKVINLNNKYMGMVRQWQQFFHGNRYSESYMDALPDFVKLAESYGHVGIKVEEPGDVEPALKEAFKRKNDLVFLDFVTDQTENVYPMVQGGKGLTEMILAEEL